MKMQRIPSVDMFGNPKKMGIIEPGPGQQPPVGVPIPSPMSNPSTAFRFEIVDAEGNPIPGAAVSIYLNEAHIMTLPLSDVGGNASLSVAELRAAESKMAQASGMGPVQGTLQGRLGQAARKLYAVIQAPGYQDQKLELADLSKQKSFTDVQQRHLVTLEKAEGGIPILPILGILAAIGAVVWISKG